ncbi:MAG: methyltransferase [bacterium]
MRPGRLAWTLLIAAYFLVFSRNFFADALPGASLLSVLYSWVFVIWLSVEYCYGSPFFQSGVVEPSALWRGVFAFFVYPFLGYLVGDFGWWGWTQLPVPAAVSWFPGMALFLAGTALRLLTLVELVRGARAAGKAGRGSARTILDTWFFRHCRHPRYLATFIQLVGSALVFNSWGGLVLAGTVGLGLILLQVRHEDAALARLFKAEFRGYAERVPMLWPRLRGQRAGSSTTSR